MMLASHMHSWQGSHMKKSATNYNSDRKFTLGRQAFAKISAVEGIELTRDMRADFKSFDDKKLTPAQRRAALARKYGKAAPKAS
jgi:hypothetical protein